MQTKTQIINDNIKLIESQTIKYRNFYNYDDLKQEAYLALATSVDRYLKKKEPKPEITIYLKKSINEMLKRVIGNNKSVHIPEAKILQNYDNYKVYSLNAKVASDGKISEFIELIPQNTTRAPDADNMNEELLEIFKCLEPAEIEVLTLYYGLLGREAHSLRAVGEILNMKRNKVGCIRNKSIKKLQRCENIENLRSFLG